ncbi:hypothetical protein BG004_002579, partial [Podila humilis]
MHCIEQLLASRLSTEKTTIHFDGPRSMEKTMEHAKRDSYVVKKLLGLEADYKHTKMTFKAAGPFVSVRIKVTRKQKDQDTRVITKDSDLMAFESVSSVTMPNKGTWMTYSKSALLEDLALQTPMHLTLAAILSNNDYTAGVFSYGLMSNIGVVRSMLMLMPVTQFDGKAGQDRVDIYNEFIDKYLQAVHGRSREIKAVATKRAFKRVDCHRDTTTQAHLKDLKRIENAERQLRVGASEFEHAVKVFVSCQETTVSNSASFPTSETHARITAIVDDIEVTKAKRNWIRFESSQLQSSAPAPQAGVNVERNCDSASHPHCMNKKKRRHGSRAAKKRYKKWRKSRFRSRTDMDDRYVPATVLLEKASPVDELELSALQPSVPCRSKATSQSSATTTASKSSMRVTKRKKLLDERREEVGPKALKQSFQSVFPTVTLTVGSLRGCLGRATNMSKEQTAQVVERITLAVTIVNSAKHVLYKLIEMQILRHLLGATSDRYEPTTEEEQEKVTEADHVEDNDSNAEDGDSDVIQPGVTDTKSFLENILDSEWAERFRRRHFEEFKEQSPKFDALNSSDLALGSIIRELAPKICLYLKLHFRKLTEILRTKFGQLSMDCDGLPQIGPSAVMGQEGINNKMDTEDVDDDEPLKLSKKVKFGPGHIEDCWTFYLRLPPAKRPRFCPEVKMADSFLDITRDVANMWTNSHFTHRWAAENQISSYGEVIKQLFIGDRDTIKAAKNKSQTTYGKRTTTMAERKQTHPDIYGQPELQRYLTRRINFFRQKNNASISARSANLPLTFTSTSTSSTSTSSASSSSTTFTPPPLPAPGHEERPYRYALNNYIRTDEEQLQILVYDLSKPRQSTTFKEFLPRIEKRFSTREQLTDAFGERMVSVVVVGIDPGEVVIINLLVKRSSLYQPTLSFRDWSEHWKRRHPAAGPGDVIDSEICTRASDLTKPTSLPSIHDLENALPPTDYTTWDSFQAAQKKYLQFEALTYATYASKEWKVAVHEHRKSKLAELDLAVAGVLRMVDEACEGVPVEKRQILFALGNGKFRSGFNLPSVHTTFLRRLIQKGIALGYKAALVDEYLTNDVPHLYCSTTCHSTRQAIDPVLR